MVPQRVRVKKNNVTTGRMKMANVKRRKADAMSVCPVADCGSTFTRSLEVSYIRSHDEEKPFTCRWPGCTNAYARQHDCEPHNVLHTNYRPFRMDALNRRCEHRFLQISVFMSD
ncbi:hypothetical protein JOM56_014380 [Amanita muscaria]